MFETVLSDDDHSTHQILGRENVRELDREKIAARYQIDTVVGRGGMGVVFAATDRKLHRRVAIKLVFGDTSAARQEREVRAMAQLNVEGVVAIYDYENLSDGRSLITMQLVDGEDLSTVIKRSGNRIEIATVKNWMQSVCRTMRAVEKLGIVHRDIKPSNILIDSNQRAIVTDFGLARTSCDAESTQTGQFLGTPAYIAPEQIENAHAADSRADIYSFGATFFHAVTGTAPFKADSVLGLLVKQKTEPIPLPSSLRPETPPELSDCIERCMAKNPIDRFQSFQEVESFLSNSAADAWAAKGDDTLFAYETIYRLHRDRLLGSGTMLSDTKDLVFDFPNGRRLSFMFGAIEESDCQAVVSSDDSDLSMGGGVSRALERVGGRGYYEFASALAPVRIGRSVVTPGFGLKAQYVFHGVTISLKDQQRPSRDIIAEIVDSCFYHADTFNVSSIAFPLLGTGAGGLSREVSLDTMFRVISRRLISTPTCVKNVRMILRPAS